jgi:putative PIN family toxin of toxin-antitoxin system
MNVPLRLVLDTNTVLALWLFADPTLRPLQACIEAGEVALYSRADALEELRRVLDYPQFGLEAGARQALLEAYRQRVTPCPPAAGDATALPLCRDRDDQKFLEIARDAGATHLITRDRLLLKLARHRLVRERFRILTPERLMSESGPG